QLTTSHASNDSLNSTNILYSHCLFHTLIFLSFFFFNDPATTEIYTLSLHDALPIYCHSGDDIGSDVEGKVWSTPSVFFSDNLLTSCHRRGLDQHLRANCQAQKAAQTL